MEVGTSGAAESQGDGGRQKGQNQRGLQAFQAPSQAPQGFCSGRSHLVGYGPLSQACNQHPTTQEQLHLAKTGEALGYTASACWSHAEKGLCEQLRETWAAPLRKGLGGSGFCGRRKIRCFLEHLAALPCKDKCRQRPERASLQRWDKGCREWERAVDALIHSYTAGGTSMGAVLFSFS